MSNKNFLVGIKYTADTSQAIKQMRELQKQLSEVMDTSINSVNLKQSNIPIQDLQKGQQAAAQLKAALQGAFNVDTGKLNLTKFNQSLKQSGMTLQSYRTTLQALGPIGQQTFTQLAQAVASAEIPVLNISKGFQRLGTTFMNTFRYQISANVLSGITSAISTAYNYAQDLNKSLNNIRIVTGYTAGRMADFAKEANKAAKALSTTTTAYTDASLIYFQQGLSDQAVKERTEATIKLANVTGQDVQTVSDQLTAIWNNFADGSKELEYYADVITKLGAATASSTDEISDGLEKFAAVAETVGLSYEMATSALATVTAETRQSADVVGTAFKTIFSRMEGLKLGETLEDGTSLNQYSQALATAGVNIKDQNGELKDMDDILNDLGSKWQLLGKDQQIALAQSVAGVRQYNQFISLMGNWDKVQENLEVANSSTGELNSQAEIYADSWEAAQERVSASLEAIYSKLIDDDFFIGLTNFLADFVDIVGTVIDSLGGLQGVIMLLGSVITKVFQNQISAGLSNFGNSLIGLTKTGRSYLESKREEANTEMIENYKKQSGQAIGGTQATVAGAMAGTSTKMNDLSSRATDFEKATLEVMQQQLKAQANLVLEKGNAVKQAERELNILEKNAEYTEDLQPGVRSTKSSDELKAQFGDNYNADTGQFVDTYNADGQIVTSATETARIARNTYKEKAVDLTIQSSLGNSISSEVIGKDQISENPEQDLEEASAQLESLSKKSNALISSLGKAGLGKMGDKLSAAFKDYNKTVNEANKKAKQVSDTQKKLNKLQESGKENTEEYKKTQDQLNREMAEYRAALEQVDESAQAYHDQLGAANKDAQEATEMAEHLGVNMSELVVAAEEAGASYGDMAKDGQEVVLMNENIGQAIDDVNNKPYTISDTIVATTSAVMGLAAAWESASNLPSIWSDEDVSIGEKMIATVTALGASYNALKDAQNAYRVIKQVLMAVIDKENAQSLRSLIIAQAEQVRKDKQLAMNSKLTFSEIAYAAALVVKDAVQKMGFVGMAVGLGLAAALTATMIGLTIATQDSTEAQMENNEKAHESTQATVELADKWEEQMKTMDELIAKHKELAAANKDTAESTQEIIDQVPAMLEAYRDIRNSLGLTTEERQKYNDLLKELEIAEAQNNVAEVERITNELDNTIAAKTAEDTAKDAKGMMTNVARTIVDADVTGDGTSTFDDEENVSLEVEGTGEEDIQALNILRRELPTHMIVSDPGEDKDGIMKLKLRTNSPANFLSDYEALKQVKETLAKELPQDSLEDSGIYENVEEILEGSKEQYDKFAEAQGSAAKFAGINALKTATSSSGKKVDEIESYTEYESLKRDVISKLEAEGMESDEALEKAEKVLSENSSVKKFADLEKKLKAVELNFDNQKTTNNEGAAIVNEVKSVYEGLSEEDKTLFLQVDLDKYNTREAILSRIQELKDEQALKEAIQVGAELKVDESTVKAYTQNLQANNAALANNQKIASKAAITNMKLSKGIEDLSKEWKDNFNILKTGNKTSLEYAEAMGAVQAALEKAFGYAPSVEFIENNLSIIDDLANGSAEALDDMYKVLGQDFTENFSFVEKFDAAGDRIGLSAEEMKNTFKNVLADIQNDDLSLGANVEINQAYLDNLQTMLDAGQLTVEDLNKMFATQGVSYDVTEYKQVQGATTTVETVPMTNKNGTWTPDYSKATRTQTTEYMQIPVINGKDDQGNVTAPANFTRTVDTSSVSVGAGTSENKENAEDLEIEGYEDQRYIKRNNNIEKINNSLAKQERLTNKLSGSKKLDSMEKEVKILKQLSEEQGRLTAETRGYLELDRTNLIDKIGKKAKFDKDGQLLNEEELKRYYQGIVIEAQKAYKASATNANKEALEEAEKERDEIFALIDTYQGTYKEAADNEMAYLESQDAIIEASTNTFLEALDQKAEAVDRFNDKIDRTLKLLEIKLKDLEDKDYSGAQAAVLVEQSIVTSMEKAIKDQQTYLDAQADYESIKDGYNENGEPVDQKAIDAAFDHMLEAGDNMLDSAQTLKEYEDQLDELLTSHLDEQEENFAEVSDELEHYSGVLEHYNNILDLTGAKIQSNDVLLEIADAQVQNAKTQLQTSKAKFDTLSKELAQAQAAGASEKVIQDLTQRVREAQQEMLSDLADGLQAAADKYATTIEVAAKEAEEALLKNSKYNSLEDAQQAFDQQQELNDLYVEEYDKLYQLNKLTRDINKSMADSDSLLANRELSTLLDEINEKRESGVEMSQYELDNLQRKYDLRLAEIALEEAQDAKDSMRLTRDSQGNWTYTYTADENKVQEAEQQYEDALYNMQQSTNEYLDQLQANILQTQSEMIEAIQNLRVEDFASVEEYEQAVEQIRKFYSEKNLYYYDQIEKALDSHNIEMERSVDVYTGSMNNSLNTIEDAYGRQLLTFKDLVLAEVTGVTTVDEAVNGFTDSVNGYLEAAKAAFDDYKKAQEGVLSIVELNFSTTAGFINSDLNDINTNTETLGKNLDSLKSKAEAGFDGVLKAVQKIKAQYAAEMDELIGKAQTLYGYLTTKYDLPEVSNPPKDDDPGTTKTNDSTKKQEDEDVKGKTPKPNTNPNPNPNPNITSKPYKVIQTATHDGGYAAVKLDNGKWYDARTLGISKVGNTITEDKLKNKTALSETNINRFNITDIGRSSTGEAVYKVGGDWYYLTQLNAPNRGHTVINDSVKIKDGEKPVTDKIAKYYINDRIKASPEVEDTLQYFEKNNDGSFSKIGWWEGGTGPSSNIKGKAITDIYWSEPEKRFYYELARTPNEWLRETQLIPFDTGGYTGEWGPEGKLAILHEKELILDKNQTSDFINSLEVMSHIVDVIDRNSKFAAAGLAIDKASAAAITERVIQQTVSIEANFPGVTSAIEIEDALNNIINDAAQYAATRK